MPAIAAACADQLFTDARTHNTWATETLPAETLAAIYELARWAPTSANCNPGRFVFVQSAEAKARLIPHLSAQNQAKSQAAAACVIVAYDTAFADNLLKLFPQAPGAASWFADPEVKQETAFRNGTLQGAYFIIAARALGLDCGPMSGFDKAGVDAEFFAGTSWKSNFLINIGHGKPEDLFPRNPRLSFEDACRVL